MIRPLTVVTFLMASGSGLYLYQSKHEVQVLDRTIERTVRETGGLREQSRLIAAEWTMLNDPERLRLFSDTYLGLKTITPSQFTSLADLDNRLPAARAEVPARTGEEPEAVAVALENPTPIAVDGDVGEALPVPPIPAAAPMPVVVTLARPPEQRVPEQRAPEQRASEQRVVEAKATEPKAVDRGAVSRPVVTEVAAHFNADARDQRQKEQRSDSRVVDAHNDARPSAAPSAAPPAAPQPRPVVVATARPVPVNAPTSQPVNQPVTHAPLTPVASTPAPSPAFGGSLLGMARGSMPPAPRPTPVSASFNAN